MNQVQLNWLDILIVSPLLFGLVRGAMRGFVSEIIAFVVVILGVLGARMFAPQVTGWLLQQFAWPKEVCDIVGYMLLFLGIAVVLSIAAKLLNRFLRAIHLGWANRLLGSLIGVLKYATIVLVAVFVMDKCNQRFHWFDQAEVVQKSYVYPYAVKAVHFLFDTCSTTFR